MSRSSSTNPRSDITKLAFYGRDANECEEFIASVRYFAFFDGSGRVIDDEWRLGLATSCLRGDALRWHASLDKTIRQDWDLFVEALLENYTQIPNPESSSQSTTPAAAPLYSASLPSVSIGKGPQSGRLRLVGADFPGTDYVTSKFTIKQLNFYGCQVAGHPMTLGPTEADVARFIPCDGYTGIYLSLSDRWLSVCWDDITAVGLITSCLVTNLESAPAPFEVVPFSQPVRNGTPPQYSTHVRSSASRIWRVEVDGTLCATWDSSSLLSRGRSPLTTSTVAVHLAHRTMYLVKDYEDFVKEAPDLYYEARLVFEPVTF